MEYQVGKRYVNIDTRWPYILVDVNFLTRQVKLSSYLEGWSVFKVPLQRFMEFFEEERENESVAGTTG